MSHILTQWVNDDISLSKYVQPTDLDREFRNGYYIGEILHKNQLFDEFPSLCTNGASVDIAVRNFIVLERILREKLEIKLSANGAYDIISGKSGSIAKLLYEIKSSLPKALRTREKLMGVGKHDHNLDFADTSSLASYPATVHEADIMSKEHNFSDTVKRRFVDKEHQFFADTLRGKIRKADRNARSHQKLLDSLPIMNKEATTGNTTKSSTKPFTVKTTSFPVSSAKTKPAVTSTTTQSTKPTKSLVTQYEMELQLRQLERAEKQKQKHQAILHQTAETIRNEIDHFERQLASVPTGQKEPLANNLDAVSNKSSDVSLEKSAKMFATVSKGASALTSMKALTKLLPPAEVAAKQTKEYLEKIRTKKLQEESSRKEREQRRRKLILSQQHAQVDLEKAQVEELLLNRLVRQSKQERRIAEQ